jgi:aminoglycoside 6'-N-acetyltransferase
MLLRDAEISVRPMRDDPDDYALIVRWRAQPHVHDWWDPDVPPPTYDEVVGTYGPRSRIDETTTSCIIERDGQPIGYVQFYLWASSPAEARAMDVTVDDATFGLDIFIGEPDQVDRGVGTRVVDLLCRYLENERGASGIALTTELENRRAQRAYEKAGFHKTKEVLELDTRDGRRVRSWLMERRRSASER